MKKRLLSLLLCFALAVGMLPATVLAADGNANTFPNQYAAQNGDTISKISHPNVAPNSKNSARRANDGVVDYIGNSQISNVIGSLDTSGTRGESYSWSAIGHGDWVYTCLLYNAMGSTITMMDSGLGYEFDADTMNAALKVLYNGDFFVSEADNPKTAPGGALVKINVKTGEVQILMAKTTGKYTGYNTQFRNAVEYNGKFYFCGSVNGAPQIWQIDPENDECKMVYGMSLQDFYAGFKQHISAGIRGLCVYGDELIVSCVMKNEDGTIEPQICSTKDPEKGFTVIASQKDLYDYPAYHFSDSIYGGSIWEIVEFNGKLYVSICTGTPDNQPDENTMQSFAVVRGEKDNEGKWSWKPVIGDKADGAKYTFGIDPERTCSGAGVLTVYNDHLYIGEYNDEEIALIQVIFNLDFGFMNKNLEQSVNLYRMDADENIELVVGNRTTMFPDGGISGIGSGFGHNENQYIWRMAVHDGKLYCGTFDTSSLLQPVGQFANTDITKWTYDQWRQLFIYIREFLKIAGSASGTTQEQPEIQGIRTLFDTFDALNDTALTDAADDSGESFDALAYLFSELPEECFEDTSKLEEGIASVLGETASYADGDDDSNDSISLPDIINSVGNIMEIAAKVAVTGVYMSSADRGCDVYVSDDGLHFNTLTTDGFGDPFNHGLRVFAETSSGLGFGTANPFYGTQWWYLADDVYTVTLPNGEGYTAAPAEDASSPVRNGGSFQFTVSINDGYEKGENFAVKVNGEPLTEKDGTYTIENITADQTVTVEGVQKKVTYPIVIADSKNGKVTSSHESAAAGTTVTLTVTPDKKYALTSLTVKDGKNEEVKLTKAEDNKYTFTMPDSEVKTEAVFKAEPIKNPFVDVPSDSYYEDAVIWAVQNRITVGTDATHFAPNGTCTRAHAITFLWRAAGSPAPKTDKSVFTDVAANDYYHDAVLWAVENGITKGVSDTEFAPNEKCTRAQIVTLMWRFSGSPAVSDVSNPFTDVSADAYYTDAVLWAVKNDITTGTSDTTFTPNGICKRCEIVTFLYRALGE